jgi:7,8-dihydropterin-6-yl-methyl-4-(beta-D-ribofuranosyl)aminobenzene 5'-phosphate synthase
MIKITVLNDNRSSGKYLHEHGLSFYIETDMNKRILFDTGPSDIFLKNAKTLGVDINGVDMIVLSHGHWDHGNGLPLLKDKTLICHPDCFIKRYRKRDGSYIGLNASLNELQKRFNLILSKEPYHVSEDVIFLGEIPRNNKFESISTPFRLKNKKDDFVYDDSGLAIVSDLGLIVISGCAHSGICNTVEYAKEVSGIERVYAVIGGFHLKKENDITLKTIEYFKKNKIDNVYPCHCVDDCVMKVFNIQFPNRLVSAGIQLNL